MPKQWRFTRPSPTEVEHEYFRTDLRAIAGKEQDYNLPWEDGMYLSYPSLENPSWGAFREHVQRLNSRADADTQYKVIYVMRRAHKQDDDPSMPDPALDNSGKLQCYELGTSLDRAIRTRNLPPPEVIVTSPLCRALQTTQIGIAPLFPGLRPVVLEGLREQVRGDKPKTMRHDKHWIANNFSKFDVENVDVGDRLGQIHSGTNRAESYEELRSRVMGVFAHIFDNFDHATTIMLMSHCYVQQVIQREITGWDVPETRRKEVEFFVGEARGYAIVVKGTRV